MCDGLCEEEGLLQSVSSLGYLWLSGSGTFTLVDTKSVEEMGSRVAQKGLVYKKMLIKGFYRWLELQELKC
jgi:hypothetical protein